ncbi:sigma-70 family RNA polymerase sigma factor [Leptolyngbya sp. FACHB-261]|uniref:sigma-70 family RNA polymerase sigma factor n=1 Tax=Leptolyngbya sp. FACHB-261 TaxID=2692806 RepID=UPI0016847207|nr:sigma-70 family RNA polymerase sigma factor [Leptolyngbya sp. FACHB-261]MBD2104053.1 sigma-70 family RNA polymerase sigma factor [Leptolyngbya sp. FACHB-261]
MTAQRLAGPATVINSCPSAREPDHDLVQQCLQGDSQSFRQLYQRHQQKVRSILYPLCGAEHLDDLVQEVFLRAWKGLPKFQRTAQFSTWLYRITWNVACDQRRGFARLRSHLENLSTLVSEHYQDLDLMHLHYQDLVERSIAQLRLEHRVVLVMHDLEELPQKEIAEALNIPVGTVKSRLFYARAQVRKFLQQEGVQL